MEKNEAFLRELSSSELLSINGGGPLTRVLSKLSPWVTIVAVGIYVYDNWDVFVEGVKEGYESTQQNK